MENLKNLEKIAKIFQPQNIITSEEIDQVLKGIMEILASYKKGTDAINEETKAVVNILLDKVVQSNKQTIDKAEIMFDDRMTDLETLLKDVKQMITDVETLASEVKDGKDADEEKIVEEVVSRIKIDPTVVTVSAQEIKDKLSSLEGDNKLDISAVKGFELYSTKVDLDYAIKTLQHQTSFLINKGGVKSIVAGTNITVDNTDPSNPVISSTSGGSPGGSTTQLQYNNAGAFGGITNVQTDGINLGFGTSAPTHAATFATGKSLALYNTADQTTNYERTQMYWGSNTFFIQTQKGGTGSNRNLTIGTVSRVLQFLESPTGTQGFYTFSNSTGGVFNAFSILTTRSNSASVAAELTIQPIYAQTSTAGYTCLLINPTENTLGSGSKLLADFQVGGVSKLKIDNTGTIFTGIIDTTVTINAKDSTFNISDDADATKKVQFQVSGVSTATTRTLSIPNSNGTIALTANNLGAFASTTSAQLAGVISDETGSGALVFGTSPTITTGTFSGTQTFSNAVINTVNAITATANAATIPVTARQHDVTNNSAGALTITLTTASATNGQLQLIRIYDFSAAAQTLTFVNTEDSTVSVPASTNGSTTLPVTVGFMYNKATSRWRCIASA